MEMNEILDRLPRHLLSLVIDQPYASYTAQDHAVWRYVMRQNVRYLPGIAHSSYLDGLKRTGISIDRIPHMYGMNRILREIGWAAVAVDGFIPPSAFMEFQAYNVLVIAADIRPINQIGYTPAPDIIHEAAGHAPIIADPVYSDYLQKFGAVGAKAFSSPYDKQLYNAIRHLSILKADPYTPAGIIRKAEEELNILSGLAGNPSELSLIRNLHWWTVEYGLIGTIDKPRIYGAGLLSSIAESYHCMQPVVKKILFSPDAVNYAFDITEPQPQLFITPDFETLLNVLDEITNTMAIRKGGLEAVKKAIHSENTATCVYSSGLQVSGTFTGIMECNGEPAYIRTTGPTSLAFNNKELTGHGKIYHAAGFGSPVGRLKQIPVPLEDFSDEELGQIGLVTGEKVELEFESGLRLRGVLEQKRLENGKIILLTFSGCTIELQGNVLFSPEWGTYDMAVGRNIISAFAGPADPDAFGLSYPVPAEKTHKIEHSGKALELHSLYRETRDIREGTIPPTDLPALWDRLKKKFPEDWLCAMEILELLSPKRDNKGIIHEIMAHLNERKAESPEVRKLIEDGMGMTEVKY